jgi:ABC-2 type transport system ATP-binding protein
VVVPDAFSGLVASSVTRRYRGFVLGPLSFALATGRALGLLGANGAGKTTLLAVLGGQSRADGGTVRWRGERITAGRWQHRHRVSYVRDVPALYDELTVRQSVAFVARLHRSWRHERAAALLDVLCLDARARVGELSRGMKMKLGLLLGVCHDVELLLLDEVTAGVDADTRVEIQQFLRRLVRERGVSLVISSHIFDDIQAVSDDILILRDGQIAHHGAMAALAGEAGLRELYFSRGTF